MAQIQFLLARVQFSLAQVQFSVAEALSQLQQRELATTMTASTTTTAKTMGAMMASAAAFGNAADEGGEEEDGGHASVWRPAGVEEARGALRARWGKLLDEAEGGIRSGLGRD